MIIRWAISSLLILMPLSLPVEAAMLLIPVDAPAASITLANDTPKPKPAYRKSAPRGATYQGYPCSQTRKTGYVLHNGCWYPRELIRNGRLIVPQSQ
ncbi:MAG: hypothetical protein H5U11_10910 [Rhizobium sp.]|nr:hypothetical protein [Rhizobium sp.]